MNAKHIEAYWEVRDYFNRVHNLPVEHIIVADAVMELEPVDYEELGSGD